MAKQIAAFRPVADVPAALERVFDGAILARPKVAEWFEEGGKNQGSNKRHSFFITTLELFLRILRHLIQEQPAISNEVPVQNRIAGLRVEETDLLDDLIPEVKEAGLPKVPAVLVEQD
ncbi:hypothetical protein P154DRAFT_433574, partial [Amniculicola lignicola CBS 123094]